MAAEKQSSTLHTSSFFLHVWLMVPPPLVHPGASRSRVKHTKYVHEAWSAQTAASWEGASSVVTVMHGDWSAQPLIGAEPTNAGRISEATIREIFIVSTIATK